MALAPGRYEQVYCGEVYDDGFTISLYTKERCKFDDWSWCVLHCDYWKLHDAFRKYGLGGA